MSEPQELSLQHAALWYPTIPDTDLCLNEASFIGEALSAPGYRPLSWILFGGPKGIYLQHLTQVTVSRLGNLDSIYFHYDTDEIVGQKKLGRRRVTESSEFMRFPIDGRGGEIITTLATSVERIDREGVYSFYKHGKLSSFKVSAPPIDCYVFQWSNLPNVWPSLLIIDHDKSWQILPLSTIWKFFGRL